MDGSPFDFIFCDGVCCLAVVDTILDAGGDAGGDAGDVAAGGVAAGDVGVPQLELSPLRLRLLLFLFFLPGLRPIAVVVVVADIVGVPDVVPCDDVTLGDITNATTASSCS